MDVVNTADWGLDTWSFNPLIHFLHFLNQLLGISMTSQMRHSGSKVQGCAANK